MFWWGFPALALRNFLMYLCIQFSTSVYAYYNLFDLYVFRIWVRHIKYICMWSSCRPDRKRIAVKQILFSWRKKKAFHFHIFPKCTHRIRLPFRHQLNYITSTQINGSARQCQECANRITFEWTEVERNRDNRERVSQGEWGKSVCLLKGNSTNSSTNYHFVFIVLFAASDQNHHLYIV